MGLLNMKRLNANYGIVRAISEDRSKITIGMPLGGNVQCQNAGFKVGQAVCFVLDTVNQRIVQVLPKDIADMQVLLGTNPLLQEAIQDDLPEQQPDLPTSEEIDYELLAKEDNNDIADYYGDPGSLFEEYLDSIGEETGEDAIGWDDIY